MNQIADDYSAAIRLGRIAVDTLRDIDARADPGDVLGVLAAALVVRIHRAIPAEQRVEMFREMFDDQVSLWVVEAAQAAAAKRAAGAS